MPGTYTVDHSDNTKPRIVIPPLSFDHSTSLKMVGYRSPVYGELIWENMLHTMEHFASNYAPVNPTEGQIWYDTLNQQLKLFDSASVWQLVWPIPEEVIVGPTQPANETGLLWHSTSSNQLRVCDTNHNWQLVWPIPEEVIVSPTQPPAEVGLLWHNTAVNKLYICDTNHIWQLVWPIPEEVVVSSTQPPIEIGLLWHNTATNKLYICDTNSTWQLVWPIEQPYPAVWVTNPSTLVGAGICLAVGAAAYAYDSGNGDGVAIFRGRDFVSEVGSVTIPPGNPPAYLSYSYTNPTTHPVLFEADLTGHGNLYYALPNAKFGLVYTVGENLNINMPGSYSGNGNPNLQGTMRQDIAASGINTRGGNGEIDVYTEASVSGARFFKVIPPGESVTIYAQWWGVLYQRNSWNGYAVIHGNMAMKVKVTRGGAYL